ncbi:flippase-like domain-containing protein [Salinirubellus salinus]|uniref:Flippase-like domain-containing protein n=1 Tax=Salinirubellus salinus TaxID=1364945 RepID=A0A9E7R211_9EURY|nr:lysylphosphatidylglycerol synthase transmembrane domain-containing protein [Salinirubellus salinus]UWM54067.1 flippase-like domain-containing protein [Salinirubellus salinus]
MAGDGFGGFATRETLAKTGVGFLVAAVLLYLVATGLGIDQLAETLADAKLRWVAVACVSTLVCLGCWAKAWQVVLREVDIEVPFGQLVVTYFAATFANYVTPLGQAGGEPFIAYVLSRDTGASYEDSLASVVTADLLNLLPFFTFAAGGLSFLLLRAELPEATRPLAFGLLALAVGVPAIAVSGWWFREKVRGGVVRLVAPVARRTSRLSVEGVRERIDDLYTAFGRIAQDPAALVEAVFFAYVGWVFFALPLYFAGLALELPVDPLLMLFIVPASTLAGLTPSPGGLVGVEVALVGLLVALTPVGAAAAFAIALVYRVASYWFALAVGGGAALLVVGRS